MSQLKTNAIRHISATSDAITLASDGGLTDIAGGQLSHRNKLYNGSMMIAQRSTSAVTISDGSNEGYQTVDRWHHLLAGSIGGSITSQQVTDAPEGFKNSLKLKCASTTTTLDGTQELAIRQKLEGLDIIDFAYGDASAKTTTVSWYMKAVNPKVMSVNLMTTLSAGRYFSKNFTPTTSWARYSMEVPGDTSNGIDETNGDAYRIQFVLALGSSKIQASDSTAWSSTADFGASGMGNFLDSTSNELYITGVQVEVGNLTPYEHRSYGDELKGCQRYYQTIVKGNGSNLQVFNIGDWYAASQLNINVPLKVTMRAKPSIHQNAASNWCGWYGNGSSGNITPSWTEWNSPDSGNMLGAYVDPDTDGTAGTAARVYLSNTDSAKFLAAQAEL
tara:strand:+ start:1004 stop:2170 length:1167 start_codon:yes stop_codon:yes gene_type:complete